MLGHRGLCQETVHRLHIDQIIFNPTRASVRPMSDTFTDDSSYHIDFDVDRSRLIIDSAISSLSCMSDPDLDQALHSQFPECRGYVTGIPYPYLNAIWLSELDPASMYDRIEEVVAFFRHHKLPFCWWTSPLSRPEGLQMELLKHGLVLQSPMLGSCLDLTLERPELTLPEGFEVLPVRDDAMFDDWCELYLMGFGSGDAQQELCDRMGELGFDEQLPQQRFIGYYRDQPIASTSLYLGEGNAGFFDDVVDTDYRRKGIGALMIEWRIQYLKQRGYKQGSVLLSPEALSRRIYERAGFIHRCLLTPAEY